MVLSLLRILAILRSWRRSAPMERTLADPQHSRLRDWTRCLLLNRRWQRTQPRTVPVFARVSQSRSPWEATVKCRPALLLGFARPANMPKPSPPIAVRNLSCAHCGRAIPGIRSIQRCRLSRATDGHRNPGPQCLALQSDSSIEHVSFGMATQNPHNTQNSRLR